MVEILSSNNKDAFAAILDSQNKNEKLVKLEQTQHQWSLFQKRAEVKIMDLDNFT